LRITLSKGAVKWTLFIFFGIGVIGFSLFFFFHIKNVFGQPTLIDTTTQAATIINSNQRKVCYANGRYWAFFNNGTSSYVTNSSNNGGTWSAPVKINTWAGGTGATSLAVWCNSSGTFAYVFDRSPSNYLLYFREGILQSNGTISWLAAEQTALTSVGSSETYGTPDISIDSTGKPWIYYAWYNATAPTLKYPKIIMSNLTNGTWQTAPNFPYTLNATDAGTATWVGTLVSLTGGKMLAIWGTGVLDMLMHSKLYDGSSWGAESLINNVVNYRLINAQRYSAVAIGDDVYLTWLSWIGSSLNNANNSISYSKNTYGSGWSAPISIQVNQSNTSNPVLTLDTITNDLYVFYANRSNIYYQKYTSATSSWDTTPTLFLTDNLTASDYISTPEESRNGTVGLVYTNSSTSPYEIMFQALNISDTLPPTYTNNGTNSTNPLPLDNVLYYAQWNDNVRLSRYIFSWNATGALCNGGFANDTAVAFTAGNWSNVTKQAPLACAGKLIDFLFYANDTSNNWNSTVNMIENEGSSNTCTYSSGTWLINCADNCIITTNTNMNGNAIIFYGTGSAYLNANIQNISSRTFVANCPITIGIGKVFG
jgi:hypothetical protein